MRISGTEPSSVILSQTKYLKKLKNKTQKVSKEAKAKRDDEIYPQNCNFYPFWYRKFECSQNATNQPQSTVEIGYMCPWGLSGPPAVTLTNDPPFLKKYINR